MACHAGIGVLMPLQHKVNAILMHQVVEKPALDDVVLALDGIQRMVEDKDLPLGGAVLQLFFKPLALGPQIGELTVAVKHKNLRIAIFEGIDHVVLDLGVQEIGEDERETALKALNDTFEVVMVARHIEDGHGLAYAVKRAEGLGPILIGGALNQVTATHEELAIGMMPERATQEAVGNAPDGVLDIAHKQE